MKKSPELKGIYLRQNIYWFRPPMVQGVQQKPMSLETGDLAEAIRLAAIVRESPLLVSADPTGVEIERFLTTPYEGKKLYSRSSRQALHYMLKAFFRHLPRKTRLTEVTREMIQTYYDQSLAGRNAHTAHKRLMSIRAFFRQAVREKKIRVNPALGVVTAELPHSARIRFCSAEQRDTLINACTRDDLKLVLMLGFHLGLRKQEIIQAVPEWFNMDQKFVDLRPTPTMPFNDHKRTRLIPMRKVLFEFLKTYPSRPPFMLRPEVKQGKDIYRYDFDSALKALTKRCNLPWVTAHVMRHTFASLLVIEGKSIYKVAKWIGDSVETTEKHYAHLAPNDADIEEASV